MTSGLEGRIRDALRVVIDPELGENVVDLGFVYDISVVDSAVRITMTATTPGCPATGFLRAGVENAAASVPGVGTVNVEMTFEPQWSADRIDPALRNSLGVAGDS
ncbi:metal-sulfur cluster assembly factor [Bradyrhizobium jicamae]|uniref:Metal-sulfur cluster assembly factor n=1 Tax=Bradyrhizobium jicamae TaxID=280332 RepID=A0ABS5FE03_9BRAD|nr:metal-sulfur cluster assembly factor [Bradyrhizobium jicamae]MBR0795008.1 metal-sulfur cluster assembly factor [Bradyrhizobium jicamae]